MLKISNEDYNTLKNIITNDKNQNMLISLISKVLGFKISKIEFDGIKKFKNISEYKFSVIKTKCNLNEEELEEPIDIYFKVIKKDKIKESIFCYWCLLYDQELLENNHNVSMTGIINNVVISEIGMERYKNSVFLEIKENNSNILKHGTEVHFIDLLKYVELHKDTEEFLEEWLKYINKNSEDILMIGVVLNEIMGRSNIKIV